MRKQIQYRPMTCSDLEQAVEIEASTFSRPWTKQNFEDSIRNENTLFLAAEQEGQLAGYCGCYQSFEEGNITNVAVKSSFRRQGIAQGLIEELMAQGDSRRIFRYFLEVRISNEPAIALYKKLGFAFAGYRKNFYADPVEDAHIMVLERNPAGRP